MVQNFLDPQALSPMPLGAVQQARAPTQAQAAGASPAPTPAGQPTQGQAAGASPVPPPPPDPALFEQLRNGWREAITTLQQDPGAQQALLRFGTSLMQPIQPGQTVAGHFGQATNVGAEALLAQRARAAQATQQEKDNAFRERTLEAEGERQTERLSAADQRLKRQLEAEERRLGDRLSAEKQAQLRDLRFRAGEGERQREFQGEQNAADRNLRSRGLDIQSRGLDIESELGQARLGLEAGRLGIDRARLDESVRQFNQTLGQRQQELAEKRRQFDASQSLEERALAIEETLAEAKAAGVAANLPDDLQKAHALANAFIVTNRFEDPNEAFLEAMDIVTGTGRLSPDTLQSKIALELMKGMQLAALDTEGVGAEEIAGRANQLAQAYMRLFGQTGIRGRGEREAQVGTPQPAQSANAQGAEQMPQALVDQLPEGYVPLNQRDRAGNWLVQDPQGQTQAVRVTPQGQ